MAQPRAGVKSPPNLLAGAHVGHVRSLYQETKVQLRKDGKDGGDLGEVLTDLNEKTFKDQRWENAVSCITSHVTVAAREQEGGSSSFEEMTEEEKEGAQREKVREILLDGAQAFGIWRVSEKALQSLVDQVLCKGPEEVKEASAGMRSWVEQSKEADEGPLKKRKTMDLAPARKLTLCGQELSEAEAEEDPRFRRLGGKDVANSGGTQNMDDSFGVVDGLTLRRFKWSLAFMMTVVSFIYGNWVVFVKYEGILEYFSWPIIFARAGGMGTAIITGLMYLSMARTFMKQFYKYLGTNSKILMVLDGHKDVHIFLARCLMVTAGVHVLAHLLSTIPALMYGSCDDLNTVIACANPDVKLRNWPTFKALQWPECPLTKEEMGWAVLIQSTPGVTGVVLVALLALVGYTGRRAGRAAHFDRFWYVHNLILVAWPVTMFIHGSNQWIGVGFPLVAFTATLPICLYLLDRVGRLLRYYLFGGKAVRIADAVIRPGKGGGANGALTNLAIEKPPGLWTYEPGMYAFICMPEFAPLQWHPFTICSGKNDEHVEFIIAGVGDWTQQLAKRCVLSQEGQAPLPRVALDGPYAAPTQSALSRPVLVAVGAGVGITPFLSLMSSMISLIEDSSESRSLPLKEAHFFWMTRSVDEFLFGRKHFTRIAQSDRLRQKVHLHLHTTAKEPDRSGAAFLFRQAVKRQSKVDKKEFTKAFDPRKVLTTPQLPWCWVNQSQLDVMWLSDLTTANHHSEEVGDTGDDAQGLAQRFPSTPAMQPTVSGRSRNQGDCHDIVFDLGDVSQVSSPKGRRQRSSSGRRPAQKQMSWADKLRSRTGLRGSTAASLPVDSSSALAEATEMAPSEAPLVPVAFGRPDFESELRAIGQHWGCKEKVHVYVCGNDAIVKGLRSTADALNAEARANARSSRPSAQKYVVTYERFG